MNHTLKRATLTLCLLAASSAAFAASTCPAADTAARAALDAQRRLQQIPSPQSADGDAGVLPAQRDAIRAYKQALVGALDAWLACSDERIEPAALQRTLAAALIAPAAKSQSKGNDSPFGTDLAVHVERAAAPRPVMFVRAGFGITCGDDNLLAGYAWEGGGWRRVLRWQADDYQDISGAYGGGYQYTPLPGGQILIVHGTPWCSSRWSVFGADVVMPASGASAQRTLFHIRQGYVIDDDGVRMKVRPDGFELRMTVGSLDTDVMTRAGIYRYRVDGDSVHRVQPAAANGRDFVDEWLKVDDALAREWSDPAAAAAALKARQALDERRKAPDTSFAYGPVRGCSAAKDRYQVEIALTGKSDKPVATRYALIRQEANGFTLLGLQDAPEPSCRGANLMPRR